MDLPLGRSLLTLAVGHQSRAMILGVFRVEGVTPGCETRASPLAALSLCAQLICFISFLPGGRTERSRFVWSGGVPGSRHLNASGLPRDSKPTTLRLWSAAASQDPLGLPLPLLPHPLSKCASPPRSQAAPPHAQVAPPHAQVAPPHHSRSTSESCRCAFQFVPGPAP